MGTITTSTAFRELWAYLCMLQQKHQPLSEEGQELYERALYEWHQRLDTRCLTPRRTYQRRRRLRSTRRLMAQMHAYFRGREDERRDLPARDTTGSAALAERIDASSGSPAAAGDPELDRDTRLAAHRELGPAGMEVMSAIDRGPIAAEPRGPAADENDRLRREVVKLRKICAEYERAASSARDDALLLRQIIDALPVGVTAVDANGQFIVFSRAVERMAGRGAVSDGPGGWTDQYGVFLPDGVTPYPFEQLPISRALRGEPTDSCEAILRGQSTPNETWILTDARPLVDANGGVRGAVAVTRDVTSWKLPELRKATPEQPPTSQRRDDKRRTRDRDEPLPTIREIEASLQRAVHHCLDSQDERGAWEVLPDARLFDTGLVLYALSSFPGSAAAPATQRAREWLERFPPQSHDPLARVLDDAPRLILNRRGPIDLRSPELYSNVFRRKALLLYTLALHAGVEVLAPLTPEEVRAKVHAVYAQRDAMRLKKWSRVDLTSVHLILEHLAGRPVAPRSREAVQYLEDMQAADGSFCHNPVSTAVAFLALSSAAPGSPAWNRCLEYLHGAQQADGTWRFCTSDVWDTSLTMRVFRDHPLFRVKALAPAAKFLAGSQNRDGGWGFRTDVESDNDTSSCSLLALHKLLNLRQDIVEKAIRYLRAQQREDGLWNTWQSDDDHPVEDCVAHILTALAPYETSYGLRLDAAREWLMRRYEETGQWSAGWYRNLPYSILEVGRGLTRQASVVRAAAASLVPHQNKDGGWPAVPEGESRASSTGLALATLMDHFTLSEPFIRQGLRYLLELQRRDGTWPGEPELYGPRPLLYHLGTNTHAFAAYGLMAAWRKARS